MSSVEVEKHGSAWRGVVPIPTDRPSTSLRDRSKGAYLYLVAMCLVFITIPVLSFRSEGLSFHTVFYATGAATLTIAFLGILISGDATSRGRVLYEDGAPLTLLPNRRGWAWAAVTSAGLTALGALVVLSHLLPGIEPVGRSLRRGGIPAGIFLVAGGVYLLVTAMARLFRARLVLSPSGILWATGFRSEEIPWPEVEEVDIDRRQLLLRTGHRSLTTSIHTFGTAPEVIVGAIRHFRDHPDRRALLATPLVALEAVAAAARQTPGRS